MAKWRFLGPTLLVVCSLAFGILGFFIGRRNERKEITVLVEKVDRADIDELTTLLSDLQYRFDNPE